jgi:hypothetical protein
VVKLIREHNSRAGELVEGLTDSAGRNVRNLQDAIGLIRKSGLIPRGIKPGGIINFLSNEPPFKKGIAKDTAELCSAEAHGEIRKKLQVLEDFYAHSSPNGGPP